MTTFHRRLAGTAGYALAIATAMILLTLTVSGCTQQEKNDATTPRSASRDASTPQPEPRAPSKPTAEPMAERTSAPEPSPRSDKATVRENTPANECTGSAAAPRPAAGTKECLGSTATPPPTPPAKEYVGDTNVRRPTPKTFHTPAPVGTPVPVASPNVAQPDMSKLEPVVQEQLRQAQVAVAADPSDAQNVGLLGALFHAYGLFPAAAAEYESAARLAPDEFKWHYLFAQVLMQLNMLPRAAAQLERAIELSPDYIPAHIALANTYMGMKQFDKATDLMVKARDRKPDMPIINYTLGRAYLGLDEPVHAIQYLKPILDANPGLGAVRAELAKAFRALGQSTKADGLLEGHQPNNAAPPIRDPVLMSIYHEATGTEAERLKGGAYLSAGDYNRAAEHFQMALNFSPDDRGAAMGLADSLAGLGRYERAEKVLSAILENEPDNTIARIGLAQLAVAQGELDKAESIVDDIATNGPASAPVLELKMHIAVARDDEPAALDALGRLAGVETTNATTYFNLASVYFSVGKIDKAEQALKKTIELDPDHALAYQALGDIAWQRGERDVAIDWYRQAVIRRADLTRACNRVAMHALDHGHFDAGRIILERCHQATPDDLDLADTLARVYALSPNAAVRDGRKAFQLAKVVYARAGNDSIRAIYTLAAANAELGDFGEARRLMEHAVELASGQDELEGPLTKAELESTLETYKQKRHLYDAAP